MKRELERPKYYYRPKGFFELDTVTREILNMQRTGKKSCYVRNAILFFANHKYTVFKIKNISNKRVFVGIDETEFWDYDSIVFRCVGNNSLVAFDCKKLGFSSFQAKRIASFADLDSAINYRDFVINRYLDNGTVVYNDDVFTGKIPRFLTIPLPYKFSKKLVKIALRNSTTISRLFFKIIMFYFKAKKEHHSKL